MGLYQTKSTDADSLLCVIKDTLLRFNINLSLCRGQCYDGASAMSGTRRGVAKILADEEPRAVYTHCYGHILNLAVNDTIRECSVMKSAFDTVNEVSKLIKKSPKREAIFRDIKMELAPETAGFRVLCPTRWTVRALTLQSVLNNYDAILRLWDEAKDATKDTEIKARIIGVETQMNTFRFLYGVSLGSLILHHSDNLSKTLQQVSITAAEGQRRAMIDTAARMRYVYIRTYAGQRPPDEFIARAATIRGRLLFFCARATCGYYSRAATIRCAAIIRINTVTSNFNGCICMLCLL